MWIVGEVSVYRDQVPGGNQFIGVDYRTPINFKYRNRPKAVQTILLMDPGIDAQYLLYQGILQKSVIDPIRLLLAIKVIHGAIAQP